MRHGKALDGARLMLVDGQADRAAFTRQWIERRGGPDAEIAADADEALDLLGAAAQAYDLVVAWPSLESDDTIDLPKVLRQCRSPVRLVVATTLSPAEMPRPGRLAGAAAIEDSGRVASLAVTLADVLRSPVTVGRIVDDRRAPATMPEAWTQAIYGTFPGQRFHAELD